VIWYEYPPPEDGIAWQRHLNTAGLDLLRSGNLTASEFVGGNVPSNAWADAARTAWRPSEYAACLWQGTPTSAGPVLGPTDTLVARLPARARALLHSPTKKVEALGVLPPGSELTCFRLTAQQARAVGDLPDELIPATATTPAIGVMTFPVLPDGSLLVWGS
jgi:hypothetical protein